MQTPAIPEDENIRLETLRSLHILDTIPEERFNRLTRLAMRLFDVPIAIVSIVDSDRQWFKSSVGVDSIEFQREFSFCGHAILEDGIFEVPDARLDQRFHDNPLVTETPNIRFYAGCPINVPNGSKIGTLCVIDNIPRKFDEEDKELLRDLTRMVETEIAAVETATIDDLTALSNRKGFEALAQHALRLCKRLEKPATLLFFDLNKFKQINDEQGHAEGDLALQTFSRILMNVFRDTDVIARIGGDEFVVLLTNTTKDIASRVLSRLQLMIDDHNLLSNSTYDLAYSVGIVEYNASKHTEIVDIINEADKLMYLDKNKNS